MRRICFSFLIAAVMAGSAAAQSGTSSQTEATNKTQAKSGAGSTGIQTQSNASLTGTQKTQTDQDKNKKEAKATGKASSSSSMSAQAGQNSISLSSGSTIATVLSKPVDARKNKEGDAVSAKVTQDVKSDGKVVIPKGSRLIGHVTQAKARAKGESESSLGIVFDRALLKGGQESTLHLVIQAMTSAQTVNSASLGEGDGGGLVGGSAGGSGSAGGRASGGGVLGGATSTVGSTVGGVSHTAGQTVGTATQTTASTTGGLKSTNIAGALTSNSTGVIGMQGLSLVTQASNTTQGSLITSSNKNVRLESGTQLLLRAQGDSTAQKP